MAKEGKYLYCIIRSDEDRNFGPIGIGQRGDVVSTIEFNSISAVISNTPMTQYVINRENMTAHERVIEEVMKDYTVLPVRFCTIAASAEEVRTLLRRRCTEFKGLLRDMDNKVEMGLKALWKNMSQIFNEIVEENSEIKRLKKNAEDKSRNSNNIHKINLGRAVKSALETKKAFEARKILKALKPLIFDMKTNDSYGDSMFLNAAFLIDRTREKELDLLIGDRIEEERERVTFRYVGPAPPFNFVTIEVKW
ncbi:MAG: GvpL/GvpF family gas vesicle protein [Thermodesulfobacteriota bacterium]|nr:GvpL/GvpF family gas vesicle protein [Thermodesulfobacteriota bacterium]